MLSQKQQIFRQRLRPRQAFSLHAAVRAQPSAFPQTRHPQSASIQPPAYAERVIDFLLRIDF
jgi:hypothetical protein